MQDTVKTRSQAERLALLRTGNQSKLDTVKTGSIKQSTLVLTNHLASSSAPKKTPASKLNSSSAGRNPANLKDAFLNDRAGVNNASANARNLAANQQNPKNLKDALFSGFRRNEINKANSSAVNSSAAINSTSAGHNPANLKDAFLNDRAGVNNASANARNLAANQQNPAKLKDALFSGFRRNEINKANSSAGVNDTSAGHNPANLKDASYSAHNPANLKDAFLNDRAGVNNASANARNLAANQHNPKNLKDAFLNDRAGINNASANARNLAANQQNPKNLKDALFSGFRRNEINKANSSAGVNDTSAGHNPANLKDAFLASNSDARHNPANLKDAFFASNTSARNNPANLKDAFLNDRAGVNDTSARNNPAKLKDASSSAHNPANLKDTLEPKRVLDDEKCELLLMPNVRAVSKDAWRSALGAYLLLAALSCIYIFTREMLYISSKEYAELEGQKEVLIEENKELERKIEALQFKNKITNYFEVKYE